MKKFLKENFIYIILIIAVLLIRTFIVTPVRVKGPSMDDTLKNGQILFLYRLGDVKRNSIVVIDKSVEGDTLIKRIIGLPGETVVCTNGIIYINDKKYDDKYASNKTDDFPKFTLKSDEYFVLGDNREVSADSRIFGPVKKDAIKGITSFSIYPFNRFGKVK